MIRSRGITSTDLEKGDAIVLLPLGSWEQHGPHLPLDTDSVIISSIVNSTITNHPLAHHFIVAPTIPITASDEHAGFAGGLSTGTSALTDAIVAICRSSSTWSRGIVLANGHGGNSDALKSIAAALDDENIRYSIWSLPTYAGADMHAGRTETSLMLHIDSPSVLVEKIPIDSVSDITIEDLRTHGVSAVSPSGVIGKPSLATAQHGEQVFNAYCSSFANHLTDCATKWLNVSS